MGPFFVVDLVGLTLRGEYPYQCAVVFRRGPVRALILVVGRRIGIVG